MNYLKAVLYGTYVVLILLLLLTGLRRCTQHHEPNLIAVHPPHIDSLPNNVERTQLDEVARRAQRIGGSGDLKVTLLWDFYADIDLYVKQPNDHTIYYRSSRDTSTGGYLDVDNTTGGGGAAENIYWANNPPSGNYSVSLHYYGSGSSGAGGQSGNCRVLVFWKGELIQSHNVSMSSIGQMRHVTNVSVE